MDFGKIITQQIKSNGDYVAVEQNIVEGTVNSPVMRTTEERIKVHSAEEEFIEYKKFSEEVRNDPDIVRPAFKIETSRTGKREGYYYVIKCYTKLERFNEA